jgi:hypothetical protein
MKKEYNSPVLDIAEVCDIISASTVTIFDGNSVSFSPFGGTPKIDGKETDYNW